MLQLNTVHNNITRKPAALKQQSVAKFDNVSFGRIPGCNFYDGLDSDQKREVNNLIDRALDKFAQQFKCLQPGPKKEKHLSDSEKAEVKAIVTSALDAFAKRYSDINAVTGKGGGDSEW